MESLRTLVADALYDVIDPELGVSVVDLGLIYNIFIKDIQQTNQTRAVIEMTLTTIGCPLFGVIERDVKEKVLSVERISEAELTLTFDPPWDTRMISPQAQAELGLE